MDYFLLFLSIIFLLIGLAGCFLPVIPGPPVSFLSLVLVHFTRYADFTLLFILIMAVLAAAATLIDLVIPLWATRKSGGSAYGMWGAAIGIVAGIFLFPPLGIIIFPVAGAIAGEMLQGKGFMEAVKSGLGAFAGFMLGIGIKLVASLTITFYFLRAVL
jgi:uncharacterized protein